MEIIHIVLGKANPDRMNGVNKVVYQLATNQRRLGRQVSVWGLTPNMTHNYGERNFETELFRASRNPFAIPNSLKKRILDARNAVFHLHGGWIPAFYRIASFMERHGISFVMTPHGAYNTIARQRSKWKKRIYFRLVEKRILEHASRIHCIGQSEVDGMKEVFGGDKAFLLPYGYDTTVEDRRPGSSVKYLFVVGFVGRLDIHTKGLDLLVKGFRTLYRTENLSRLWIIGDGPERPALEALIKENGLEKAVVLWGSKYGAEKDELIRQMHVFAHPSRNEGLPSAVLEASALGVPCIVSNATNVAGVVEQYQSGIGIANENVADLADGLLELKEYWAQNTLVGMGSNAIEMVRTEFDWHKIVSRFDDLYNAA